MEIKGKVIQVLPMQSGTSTKGEWKRQTVIVEYKDGSYTSKVALDNSNKAEAFSKLNVGDECTFKCNTPTSREYNGRWYTSVTCWGWDVENKAEEVADAQEATPAQESNVEPSAPTTTNPNDDDPF